MIVAAVAFVLASGIGGCVTCLKLTKVEPGHVGVSVKKCSGGGVVKTPIPTGYYWRELFCEEVVTYPISMQSLILTSNVHEGTGGKDGTENDQSITVTSSEGLGVQVDVAMNYTIDATQVPIIYERWRSDLDDICLLYTSPSPRDRTRSRMPSSA